MRGGFFLDMQQYVKYRWSLTVFEEMRERKQESQRAAGVKDGGWGNTCSRRSTRCSCGWAGRCQQQGKLTLKESQRRDLNRRTLYLTEDSESARGEMSRMSSYTGRPWAGHKLILNDVSERWLFTKSSKNSLWPDRQFLDPGPWRNGLLLTYVRSE